MEKQIIVVKPGSLSSKDKEKLTKAGNIVIEHEKAHEISYHPNEDLMVYVRTVCCRCGDRIYLERNRHDALRKNGEYFYCPAGHQQYFKKPAALPLTNNDSK